LIEQKRVHICFFVDAIIQGRSNAVAGGGGGAKEDWMIGLVGGLQSRGHFSRLPGIHAAVVITAEKLHGRISGPIDHAVKGGISVEGAELVGIFHGAEFGDVEFAVGLELGAEGVVDSHVGDDGGE